MCRRHGSAHNEAQALNPTQRPHSCQIAVRVACSLLAERSMGCVGALAGTQKLYSPAVHEQAQQSAQWFAASTAFDRTTTALPTNIDRAPQHPVRVVLCTCGCACACLCRGDCAVDAVISCHLRPCCKGSLASIMEPEHASFRYLQLKDAFRRMVVLGAQCIDKQVCQSHVGPGCNSLCQQQAP
jgi:hypothetical protein